MKSRLLLVMALLLAGLVVPMATPHRVAACSGGWEVGYKERISQLYDSELIVSVTLAEVRSVRVISPTGAPVIGRGGTQLPFVPPNGTVAMIQPYVLWSTTALAGNEIGPLGYIAPDCSGGPSFRPGDKVLLFLYKPRYPVADYSISPGGDTILFRGESAFFLSSGYMEPAGSTEEVLGYLLSVAKSPETTTGPARAFLGLPPAD